MMTVRFNLLLAKTDAYGYAPLQIVCHRNKKRFRIYLGEKIKPKYWNSEREKVKSAHPTSILINARIEKIREELLSIAREADILGQEISNEAIKYRFKGLEASEQKKVLLSEIIEMFISERQLDRQRHTILTYTSLHNDIQEFTGKAYKTIHISEFGIEQIKSFQHFLTEVKGLSNNTARKKIFILRAIFRWAEKKEIPINHGYRHYVFEQKSKPKTSIALDREELLLLENLELKEGSALAHARDVFVFSCYTGLRYSDVSRLKPENWHGDKLLLCMQKTSEEIQIPLFDKSRKILEKYRGKFILCLPVISNQKYNVHLKEIAALAKIDTPIQQVNYKGVRRIEVTKQKYELVTSHTARRTFTTLSLTQGIRPEIVQRLLGHSDIRQTMHYAKISSIEVEAEFRASWEKARQG